MAKVLVCRGEFRRHLYGSAEVERVDKKAGITWTKKARSVTCRRCGEKRVGGQKVIREQRTAEGQFRRETRIGQGPTLVHTTAARKERLLYSSRMRRIEVLGYRARRQASRKTPPVAGDRSRLPLPFLEQLRNAGLR